MKILKKLSEDVRDLYCKTGNKAIEASLISILASLEGVSDDDIVSWIGTGSIQNKISDKFVLQALMSLKNINPAEMGNFNSWMVGITSPAYGGTGISKYLNYFIAFADIMDDPEASLILRPFFPVLNKIRDNRDILGSPTINTIPIISDVKTIQGEFEKSMGQHSPAPSGMPAPSGSSEAKGIEGTEGVEEKVVEKSRYEVDRQETGKETKKEKVQNLYDDVYMWLSQDASNAFSKLGKDDLAGKIDDGMLGNTYALSDHFKENGMVEEYGTPEINFLYENIAKTRFIAYAIRNINQFIASPQGHVDFYRELKEFVMSTLRQVDKSEIESVRRERKKMRGAPSRTTKDFYEKGGVDNEPEIQVDDDAWLSGLVIGMTSYILSQLHSKFNLD